LTPIVSDSPNPHLVPAGIRRALESVFSQPVGDVRISHRPLYVRLHGRCVRITTRRDRICLRCGLRDFLNDPELILHEYFHVLRQWNTGTMNRRRYLLELCKNGYVGNRYEIEARRFAKENLGWFKKLLRANADP
jgi:hypothetical protein